MFNLRASGFDAIDSLFSAIIPITQNFQLTFYYEPKFLQTQARTHIFILNIIVTMLAVKIFRERLILLDF